MYTENNVTWSICKSIRLPYSVAELLFLPSLPRGQSVSYRHGTSNKNKSSKPNNLQIQCIFTYALRVTVAISEPSISEHVDVIYAQYNHSDIFVFTRKNKYVNTMLRPTLCSYKTISSRYRDVWFFRESYWVEKK